MRLDQLIIENASDTGTDYAAAAMIWRRADISWSIINRDGPDAYAQAINQLEKWGLTGGTNGLKSRSDSQLNPLSTAKGKSECLTVSSVL